MRGPQAVLCSAPVGPQTKDSATSADSAGLLRAISDHIPDVIFAKDADGRMLFANPAALALVGKRADEVLGKTDLEFLDDKDAARQVMENDRRVMDGRVPVEVEEVVPLPDGSTRVWLSRKAPYFSESGEVLGLLGISRDITRRKSIMAQQQELSAHRQLALDAAGLGWWHYDPETRIASWDKRYREIFRVEGEQRPNEEILKRLHPDDLPRVWEKVEAALDPRDPQPYLAEYRIMWPDGSIRWIEAHGAATFRGDGAARRATALVGTVEDITDRKRDAEALRTLNAELEEAHRRKDAFLANLSHELRTPLNAVLGWTSILRSRELPDAERERAYEVIQRNAEAQKRLVEDLLDVASLNDGRLQLHAELIPIAQPIGAAIEAVRPAADAKGLAITFASDEAWVRGDAVRLQQVFWNILSNAVKFTAAGQIAIHVQAFEHSVDVRIADTGIGVPATFLPVMFWRFAQVDPSPRREQGGLGIGLAIVKQLVELHGGSVWGESEGVGRGLTVTVRLPRAR